VMVPVAELLMVAPLLLAMPKPSELDTVMMPELLMVPPEKLLRVPKMSIWPLVVISMVPVAVFSRIRPLSIVTSPLIVIAFEELLSNWPLVPIISSEPLTIVSVPVVSVNEISSVTITAPPMRILSEPVGSVSLLQLSRLDHSPSPASPSQIPFERTPKSPASTGDWDVDAGEVSTAFFRFPLTFTVMVKTPIAGEPFPVESTIVITKVDPSLKVPV